MKIKSYFAATVEAALAQAREELGPEAMLMNTRKAMAEARHLGEYEAVFALAAPERPAAKPEPEPVPVSVPADESNTVARELANLRAQLEHMSSSLSRMSTSSSSIPSLLTGPTLAALYSSLVACEIYPELVKSILSGLRMRGENLGPERIRESLRDEVKAYCRVQQVETTEGRRRPIAVIGPPGCGKTTTLVKLAIRLAVSKRIPVQFVTLDLERVAAADQLQTFSSILSAGFQVAESTHVVERTIEEHGQKSMIFIDTPGFGPRDKDAAMALAHFLKSRRDIEVHLVLPATMKAVDLSSTVDRFEAFHPERFIFTRVDETNSFGGILNELARKGGSVSYLTNGQRIPEDLVVPSSSVLADLVLSEVCGKPAALVAA